MTLNDLNELDKELTEWRKLCDEIDAPAGIRGIVMSMAVDRFKERMVVKAYKELDEAYKSYVSNLKN